MRAFRYVLLWSMFILLGSQSILGQEENDAESDTESATENTDVDIDSIEREIEGDSDVEEFEGREKIRADDAISLPSDI